MAVAERVGWTCLPGVPVTPRHPRLQPPVFLELMGDAHGLRSPPIYLAPSPRSFPLIVAVTAEPRDGRRPPDTFTQLDGGQRRQGTRGLWAALCGQWVRERGERPLREKSEHGRRGEPPRLRQASPARPPKLPAALREPPGSGFELATSRR